MKPGAWLVTLTALVTLLLRLPWLTQSIWFDEAFRTFVVLKGDSARNVLLHDVHNPLYNACMYVWIRVFGDSEVSIRIPSLLVGYAVAALVWWWGERRLARNAGVLAAVLLMVNPLWSWFSCEAKNNMVLAALATVGVIALCEAAWDRRAGWIGAATLVITLAVWADFTALVAVVPAAAVLVWQAARSGADKGVLRRCAPVVIPIGVAAVLSLPLAVWKAQDVDRLIRGHIGFFHPYESLRLLLVWFPTGNAIFPQWREEWWWSALILSPVTLAGAWCGLRAILPRRTPARGAVDRGRVGPVILACIAGPLLIMWLGSELGAMRDPKAYIYQARNLLCVIPFVALAGAAGVLELRRRAAALLGGAMVALPLLCALLALTMHRGAQILDFHPKGDWRAAAAWMRERGGDRPLVVSEAALLPLRYYMPNAETRGDAIDVVAAARGEGHEHARFVLVHDWWRTTGVEEQLRAVYGRCTVIEEVRLSGLRVVWVE